MTPTLTIEQWIEILQNTKVTTEKRLAVLQVLYSFDECKASSSQIAKLLGYSRHSPVNRIVGAYGEEIAQHYDVNLSLRATQKYKYWDIPFRGESQGKLFIWQLKPELITALEATGLTGIESSPEELSYNEQSTLQEGIKKTVVVNTYERNPIARQKCIEHWKPICSVCSFDFEKIYGDIGKGFIHVHHLVPLSHIGRTYQINPIEDLRPVCPNCHAMLHKKTPPFSIEELQTLLKKKE